MSGVTYLDPGLIIGHKRTPLPYQQTRSGYGRRLRTPLMLRLRSDQGGHWHRVFYVCWSNMGSAYVEIGGLAHYLGALEHDPRWAP